MSKSLAIIYGLLSRKERRNACGVVALMLVNACFALVGVGSILPFLTVAMDPSAVHRSGALNWAYVHSGLTTVPDFVMALGVAILILIILMNVVATLALWVEIRFIHGFAHALSLRLMRHYLSRPYEFFLARNTADLSKDVLSEVQEQIGGTLRAGTALISRGLVAAALTVLLLVVQPLITLAAVGVLGLLYVPMYSAINRRLAREGRKRMDANTARYKFNAEAFGGVKAIKTLGREEFFLRQFEAVSLEHTESLTKSKIYPRLPLFLIETLAFGSFIGGFLVLTASGYSASEIVPVLGFCALAATRLLPAFQEILGSLAQFRFNEHLLHKFHRELSDMTPVAPQAGDDERALPFAHRVKLESIGFQYAGTDKPVIANLTLEIPRNTSIALVGTTGAGKTTLVDILLGLLVPQQGRVLIDATPLDITNVRAWRRNVGYVPQDVFLTDDTIARNVALGLEDRLIDRGAVESAAAIAHIHDFIVKELPLGYDTVVGERGVRLSGGQRQRLGIARALYEDPEFLILDEATSDIDNVTEEYISDAIQRLAGTKTLLIVAHRLQTVKRCDRVCILDRGRIVATGTFDELAGSNPAFQQMIRGMRREPADAEFTLLPKGT